MEKHYVKGELTVTWKPDLCIHSKRCWQELLTVFNPRVRPWINLEAADNEAIIAQVERCPSGALSWSHAAQTAAPKENATVVEVLPNGPLLVHGNITVKDAAGQEITRQERTAFCRCGASANKPYCDGSHNKTGFKG